MIALKNKANVGVYLREVGRSWLLCLTNVTNILEFKKKKKYALYN